LKRKHPGQNLVKRDAEGVEIGAEVHGAIHAAGLLRGAVGKRAFNQLWIAYIGLLEVETRRNAEVDDPDAALLEIDEDVERGDVFVDDVLVMNLRQRTRRGDGDVQHVDDVAGFLTKGGLEVLAVHPFHFEDVAVVLSGLTQRAANSGELQPTDDVELVVKLRDVGRRGELVVEHLDRGDHA
jgi:hypothetical protein